MVDVVELIPGTSLPIRAPGEQPQVEGRGGVQLRDARRPPSMIAEGPVADGLDTIERHLIVAALRRYQSEQLFERVIMDQVTANADGTTGNCAVECYEVPQGYQGRVTLVTADTYLKATVTPTAPAANAATWCYIAVLPASSGRGGSPPATDLTAGVLRNGLVDFRPNPANSAGAALPASFGYGDDGAPVVWGGETLWFVLVGGSQASVQGAAIKVAFRINLYQRGLPG